MLADFCLGEWTVRPQRGLIERGAHSARLTPKSMAVLECLAGNNGETVSRNDLFDAVWPGGEVSNETLTQCIAELRKAFGDTAKESLVIETIPKIGFRLIPAETLLGEGLAKVTRASATPPREAPNSIAVLAFDDMSPDGNQQYMAEGLAEELLNCLTQIPRLRVTARTSAFSFRKSDTTIREIGRLLNVAYVVEGSVRTTKNQIRITAQLINVATDSHVWSESYTRRLDDIFVIQDDIAARVADKLELSLVLPSDRSAIVDGDTYSRILQAKYLTRQGSNASYTEANNIYNEILIEDPKNAQCLTLSAFLLVICYGKFDDAKELISRALACEPQNTYTYTVLGTIALAEDDLELAAQHLTDALDLNASNHTALTQASRLYQALGRTRLDLAEYALARDTFNSAAYIELGMAYHTAERYADMLANSETGLKLNAGATMLHFLIATAQVHFGLLTEALAAAQREPYEMHRLISLISVYHAMGNKRQSHAYLNEIIEKYGQDRPYFVAWPHAVTGNNDLAFEYLEKSINITDYGLYGILVNPGFSNLYSDPRWMPFLEKIGRSPERLDRVDFNIVLPE
jgi:adenylate cyclase